MLLAMNKGAQNIFLLVLSQNCNIKITQIFSVW